MSVMFEEKINLMILDHDGAKKIIYPFLKSLVSLWGCGRLTFRKSWLLNIIDRNVLLVKKQKKNMYRGVEGNLGVYACL